MASVGQLLEQVRSVTNWVTNRVQVLVVAGTFGPGLEERLSAQGAPFRLIEEAGFGDAFLETPAAERITVAGKAGQPGGTADYIFTKPAGCAINPRILSAAVSGHYPVTCELELDQAKVIAAQAAREAGRSKAAAAASPTPLPTAHALAFNRYLVTASA